MNLTLESGVLVRRLMITFLLVGLSRALIANSAARTGAFSSDRTIPQYAEEIRAVALVRVRDGAP